MTLELTEAQAAALVAVLKSARRRARCKATYWEDLATNKWGPVAGAAAVAIEARNRGEVYNTILGKLSP
jgi:porphobilinogen deaminase